MNKKIIIRIALIVLVIAIIGYLGFGDIKIGEEEKVSTSSRLITGFEDWELPIFIEWIKQKNWFEHYIIATNHDDKLMTIRDGRGNVFDVTYEFAATHLREHHLLGSYIEELGIEEFVDFALENKLYQHKVVGLTADGKKLMVIGDEGRSEFETSFELSLPTFFSHITFHHAWSYENLIDDGYCEDSFSGKDVEQCRQRLSLYNK